MRKAMNVKCRTVASYSNAIKIIKKLPWSLSTLSGFKGGWVGSGPNTILVVLRSSLILFRGWCNLICWLFPKFILKSLKNKYFAADFNNIYNSSKYFCNLQTKKMFDKILYFCKMETFTFFQLKFSLSNLISLLSLNVSRVQDFQKSES